ncbi:cell division protein SepF [Pectinatus cerevisiiphilus]|uniref:Cell division protein SepF n=1 Tax=Pectinatus cerevisiiphilus TaxID=86956 RepID=A0A4R3K793_9FIRM|nr:cell division protein SepF [Pectinatus cerevisiiphilus]TCS78740.1 cell division inhibitor SepF [Pectinatus cerevisiiphilus]
MTFFDKLGSKMGLADDNDKNNADAKRQMDHELDETDIYASMSAQDNVVDFQSAAANSSGSGVSKQMKVIIIEPTSFDDAQQISDYIKTRKPVVLNFENTEDNTARRIIDFISGATYALAGDIKKIGQHIFLCAPSNVNVTFSDTVAQKTAPSHEDKLPWE